MLNLQEMLTTFGLENAPRFTICDAAEFQDAHVPPFSVDLPVLLRGVEKQDLIKIQQVLC